MLLLTLVFVCIMSNPPALRQTDFLPTRFEGSVINRDACTAHFLLFSDYLESHKLSTPGTNAELQNVFSMFKRTLQGKARLWVEDQEFTSITDMKRKFIARFSPSKSKFALVNDFANLSYATGDSAEVHLSKIREAARKINYGDDQIRDKFLSTLPSQCRASVLMSAQDDRLQTYVDRAQCYFDLNANQPDPVVDETSYAATSSTSNYRSRPPKRDFKNTGSRNREYAPRARQIFCDFCLKPGHKWRQCRERQDLIEQRGQRFSDEPSSRKSTESDSWKQISEDSKNGKQDFQ